MSSTQVGELIMRRILDSPVLRAEPRFVVEIVHADPTIGLSDELLHELSEQQQPAGWQLEPPPDGDDTLPGRPHIEQWTGPAINRHYHDFADDPWPCKPDPGARCWANWLLHIEGCNRTVIYRISTYDQQRNAWRASWPD